MAYDSLTDAAGFAAGAADCACTAGAWRLARASAIRTLAILGSFETCAAMTLPFT